MEEIKWRIHTGSEHHFDDSYQHIIHSMIRKRLIEIQLELEEMHKLESIIDSKLAMEFNLAFIRQDPSIVNFGVAEKVMQCTTCILAKKLPSIDVLVTMALEIKQSCYILSC